MTDTVLDPKNDMCSDKKALKNIVSEQKQIVEKNSESSELKALLGDESVVQAKEKTRDVSLNTKSEPKPESSKKFNSFLDAPAEYYTINITTTNGLNEGNGYVSSNGLESSNSYVYPFGPEMKSAKVIYGIFKSVKEANIAISKLPSSVIANKPYIDNIAKHQKLYAKYNK